MDHPQWTIRLKSKSPINVVEFCMVSGCHATHSNAKKWDCWNMYSIEHMVILGSSATRQHVLVWMLTLGRRTRNMYDLLQRCRNSRQHFLNTKENPLTLHIILLSTRCWMSCQNTDLVWEKGTVFKWWCICTTWQFEVLNFQRRFAALSILTCRNEFLRGLANVGHVDADVLDNDFHHYCMSFLKEMRKELAESCNSHLDLAFDHIKKKFDHKNRFMTMTTCGYKMLHSQNASDGTTPPKQIHGYFLYKYLSVAVSIPTHRSCYHTFSGTMGVHQTTVPLTPYTPSTSPLLL